MIIDEAAKLVAVIMKTTTATRGALLLETSKQLRNRGQNYSAMLFAEMAEKYGYTKDI